MENLKHSNKLLFEVNEEPGKPGQLKFTDNLSHELRTPLHVIIGFSQLMLDEVPGTINEEQRQSLNDILSHARRLQSLINRIFDLPGTQPGKEE